MLSDICVSLGEIGLTCVHALAYGTPIITHDNPDLQGPEWEAITLGVTGALFKYNDPKDLARVLKEWLDRKVSRGESAEACRDIIKRYYNPEYKVKVINAAVQGVSALEANL